MQKLFDGIFSSGAGIYTKNLIPGRKVYGEALVKYGGVEYREWDAFRSKYCAAIKNGLVGNIFFSGANVLYLGSAEGTTVSHVSDIVGDDGSIFCVDVSEIAMMKLVKLAEERANLLPILSDAQKVGDYRDAIAESIGEVDALFQDISQRNQAEIFVRNSVCLKKGGFGALTIKTKSISQSKNIEDVLKSEKEVLKREFDVIQVVDLEPYEKHHYLILAKKK